MKDQTITTLIELRKDIIEHFNSLRDYKNNPNALMKERDHAQHIGQIVKRIDNILKEHVTFS